MTTAVHYRDLLGVRFVPEGRDIRTGLDCYGLAIVVMGRLGVTLPDPWAPQSNALIPCDTESWLRHFFGGWRRIERPVPGCLVLFSDGGNISDHIGVMINEREFLHTRRRTGVVVGNVERRADIAGLRGFYVRAA